MTLFAPASGMKPADAVFNNWSQLVPGGTSRADIERPEFWSHHAARLMPMDQITLNWEDGEHWALVLVISKGTGFAKVKVLHFIELQGEVGIDADPDYIVKWRSPQSKYAVIRRSDGTMLKDGFGDKADAETFARDYQRTIAA